MDDGGADLFHQLSVGRAVFLERLLIDVDDVGRDHVVAAVSFCEWYAAMEAVHRFTGGEAGVVEVTASGTACDDDVYLAELIGERWRDVTEGAAHYFDEARAFHLDTTSGRRARAFDSPRRRWRCGAPLVP